MVHCIICFIESAEGVQSKKNNLFRPNIFSVKESAWTEILERRCKEGDVYKPIRLFEVVSLVVQQRTGLDIQYMDCVQTTSNEFRASSNFFKLQTHFLKK